MKIALFGRFGQLGFELRRTLSHLGEVVAIDREDIDLTNPAAVAGWLDSVQPAVVINASAYTAVDRAESDEAAAFAVNAEAPRAMAAWARQHNAWFVHYSTDYVYTGEGETPWCESSPVGPLNAYGRSKLAGDEAVLAENPNGFVFRTSWVVGAFGGNFLKTMLKLMQMKEELSVVADQVGVPASARFLAEVTLHTLLIAMERGQTGTGLYHLVPTGETNWCDYVAFIRDWVLKNQPAWAAEHLKLKTLTGIATEAYPTPARRPKNSRLDTRKLCRDFQLSLPSWQTGVEDVLEQLFAIELPHP